MQKVIGRVKFNNEILLDAGEMKVDLRQKAAEGIFEIHKNFVVIPKENKITKSDIHVPMSNVSSIQINQVLEGKANEHLST